MELVCRKCEYDMTSLGRGVRCPECGTESAGWPAALRDLLTPYDQRTMAAWYAYSTAVVLCVIAIVAGLTISRVGGLIVGIATWTLMALGVCTALWRLVPRSRRPRIDWQSLVIGFGILLALLSSPIGR